MNKVTLSIIISFLLILVMGNNIPHGAELYAQISDRSNATIKPIAQGYFVMILFDVGVIIMLFCDDMAISIMLALFLFVVNILFWNVPWEIRYWHFISFQAKVLCVWKAILSGMFSFLMHKLSDTLRKLIRSIQLAMRIRARSISLEAKMISHPATVAITTPAGQLKENTRSTVKRPISNGLAALLQDIEEKEQFICPSCERSFASQNALNAHKKTCKTII